jgi:hypothetical protein
MASFPGIKMERRRSIETLAGEVINSVCFVEDYVEIHFNGPILRCLANPVLKLRGETFVFPAPGSRDALCSIIGFQVAELELQDEIAIRLRLDPEGTLLVPLDRESRVGSEAAHFVSVIDNVMDVW